MEKRELSPAQSTRITPFVPPECGCVRLSEESRENYLPRQFLSKISPCFEVNTRGLKTSIKKERLILRNPTEDCVAPKPRKVEINILPPEAFGAYLKAAQRHHSLPMFYLELVSGLRKGELVALHWDDVDTEHNVISVSRQLVRNPDGSLELTQPKTETSIRQISIPQEAVDLLIQEHNLHPDNPYLFPSSTTGKMYHPDSVVKLHEKILRDAGLPHIRFHDLRHTFATTALQNGVDIKTVSAMLGHYDAGFTLKTYTHATRQKQDEAAEVMGNFMSQVM